VAQQGPLTPAGPHVWGRGAGALGAATAPTTGLVLTITFLMSDALAVVTVMPVVARDLGGLRLYRALRRWARNLLVAERSTRGSCRAGSSATCAARR